MRVTNITEAPKPFLWATENSSWPPNADRLYVTQLFAPPMMRRLMINHYDEIENDVIDYYYRILGTAVHSVIEQAAKDRIGISTEVRVAMPKEWFGIQITGRIDWIDYIDSILADIKTASAAIAGRGVKDDWVYQGNIYRYMLYRIHGWKAENLRIYPLYRDWSGAKAGHDHPISPYGDIELPIWSIKDTHKFIEKCVADHMAKKVRFCSDEERWKTPDCYAVKKKGAAKAVAATTLIDGERVPIPTKELATKIMNSKKNAKELSVEFRPGGCRRCNSYCDVREVCKRVNAAEWAKDEKETKDES
ncbi:hypothetical protein LCGC14_1681690 [marine sediment metagenome]|uniref:PD-(D/E)XK endonuclease-like domain-containing protein n=1 Tax=marine sediment metagenome TaxID=412755 RepID=A0A0F9KNE3_9ZZZZ